jgi:hypothetical protein
MTRDINRHTLARHRDIQEVMVRRINTESRDVIVMDGKSVSCFPSAKRKVVLASFSD